MMWVGMPKSTEEEIESEVVSLIHTIVDFKKRNDWPGAKWRVGTTWNPPKDSEIPLYPTVSLYISGWHLGSAHRATREIVRFHEMEIDGKTNEKDSTIYAYTDRSPTLIERKQRSKEPLTLKQKFAFREIEKFTRNHGEGPTTTELMQLLGHRSSQTTRDVLDILERKNWAVVMPGRRIELL